MVAGQCERLFFDPTSLPVQWKSLSPDTGQPFLFCTQSEDHVPGPLLHISPLIVLLPFAEMLRRFLFVCCSAKERSWEFDTIFVNMLNILSTEYTPAVGMRAYPYLDSDSLSTCCSCRTTWYIFCDNSKVVLNSCIATIVLKRERK